MHSSYTKKVSAADGATYNNIKTMRDIVIKIRDIKIFLNESAERYACMLNLDRIRYIIR